MNKLVLLALFALCAVAAATVHFEEKFGDDYQKNWVVSDWKKSDGTAGTFKHTAGDFFGDAEEDKGLQTGEDARFYAISSKIATPFSNEGKDLVVQFSVKHQQNIDCGGGYIKLLTSSLDQKAFNGDSPYMIMFGPDICGTSTRRVHVIFTYKGKNHLIKKDVKCETDKLTHVYTLIVRSDNTYEVRIDGKKVESGAMSDDWDFLPPKQIQDPAASKPADWVDAPQMPDPEDVKLAGWDDVPAKLPDAKATKPDDWDDDEDGACAARRSVVRRLAARACAGGPTPLPLPPSLPPLRSPLRRRVGGAAHRQPRVQGRVEAEADRQPRVQGRVGAPGDRQPRLQGGPQHVPRLRAVRRPGLRALAGQVGHHL